MADTSKYPLGMQLKNPDTGQIVERTASGWKIIQAAGPAATEVADPNAPGAQFMRTDAPPKISATDQKYLTTQRQSAQTAQGMARDAERFAKLNERKYTGGVQTMPFLRNLLGAADTGVGEMMAITEKLTPQMREAGSGAMSDRDVAMYKASTLDVGKPGPTNAALSRVVQAGAKRQGDYAAFLEEWAGRRGSVLGAQEAWSAYAEANPLFDNSNGLTQLRQTTPWRQWFGVQRGGQAQPARGGGGARPAATGRPAKPVKQMSNAELMALARQAAGGG